MDSVPTTSAQGVLTLLGLRGVGPQTVERLSARFSTLGELREGLPALEPGLPANILRALRDEPGWITARDKANDTLEEADRRGVRVLTPTDADYPPHLRTIPDRPLVVYVKGRLPRDGRCVACIGTREPSTFGETVARRIASLLAERGWSIISGLALGVDAIAHEAALAARGHTVAVLANGLDAVYPKKNAELADRILDAGGAWLSEQPFGTPALARNLIQRDRLQSGMSVATIVMQTDVEGGSMHTVRYTLMQGREVIAPVPYGAHAEEPKSRGIVALTNEMGVDFARLVNAHGEYLKLLTDRFARRTVATALKSRADYAAFVKMLELLANTLPARAAAADAVTAPGAPADSDAPNAPQLGLSLN